MLDLSTQGGLASALKKNLAGSVRLELRDGAVRGVDLGEIIRIAKGTGTSSAAQQTPFTTLDATFRVAAGVARNDDLVAVSPLMRITGSGEIDLADERVDYLAKATLTNDALGKLQGRTVPVRLRGPFASIERRSTAGGGRPGFGWRLRNGLPRFAGTSPSRWRPRSGHRSHCVP